MAGEDEKGKDKARGGRGADEARSARRAHGAVHGPGAGALRLRVAAAARVPAGEGRGGRRAAGAPAGLQEINVALLGAGAQGQVLTEAMLRIPGLRFRAVCDIWTEYNQKRVVNTLKRFKHEVNGYEDYREMLDKEKELDAVIIATPDFWHAQHTIDCLEGRQARVLREGDVEHARGRAQHGGSPPARPASSSRSATSAARTRATSTATRSCSARPSCSAASSPSTGSGTAR